MKSEKPIIIVDIDDVIAAHAPAFVQYSNEKFGLNLTIDDYHDHWGEVWGVDLPEREKRGLEYHDSGHIATYKPIEGASEALRQLKSRFKLIILTTRRRSIDQLTKDWLGQYYPNIFDDIVFAGFFDNITADSIMMTKAKLANELSADYLIDDQLKHCQAAAKIGIQALLFGDYPWNQTDELPRNVTRVKNWQDVLGYFLMKSQI